MDTKLWSRPWRIRCQLVLPSLSHICNSKHDLDVADRSAAWLFWPLPDTLVDRRAEHIRVNVSVWYASWSDDDPFIFRVVLQMTFTISAEHISNLLDVSLEIQLLVHIHHDGTPLHLCIWCDWTPSHFCLAVEIYVDHCFPSQWISCSGPQHRPPGFSYLLNS
jgi:hypothetical protein